MRIQIAKRTDGTGLLRFVRDDGSQMWQKQSGRHAAHFALHDLTHFAVESTLRYQNGFFGLLKQGWEMDDITGKGRRGPLPAEAIEVEELVGLFDAERACGGHWTIDDFNHFARLRMNDGFPARTLTGDEVALVKQRRSEVFARWVATPMGECLEVEF